MIEKAHHNQFSKPICEKKKLERPENHEHSIYRFHFITMTRDDCSRLKSLANNSNRLWGIGIEYRMCPIFEKKKNTREHV